MSYVEMSVVVDVQGLEKRYAEAAVFSGVSLQVKAGEFVAIVGDSGVGKSTLLNCMAGLDHWDAGSLKVLPHLDVAQNIGLPLLLLGQKPAQFSPRVNEMLQAVGLDGLGTRLPQQLSGGQLQRVAIARALVHRPALVLADEPTGNLDPNTAERVMDVLIAQTRERGAALILVTHSQVAAARADRVLHLTAQGVRAPAAA
jgi:putative ABC transport system ATP-binding protein